MPNLTVYDPTPDLLGVKEKEGLLYWRTDTHWNQKGAFWAYAGLAKTLNLPVPKLEFRQGGVYSGDLVKISRLKNFPLHADDNWQAVWNAPITWTQTKTSTVVETEFGPESVVTNVQPLSEKTVWVIGDSFVGNSKRDALRQYLNATFKEVYYVGHHDEKLKTLATDLGNVPKVLK